jgi:hypothetical protein
MFGNICKEDINEIIGWAWKERVRSSLVINFLPYLGDVLKKKARQI